MANVEMKCFSLFSGVGGFEQGFPEDFELVGFSEIDKYASMVLKYHYPNTKNYGDCTKINYDELPNFDLLTGGSPCQDFSIAGKRRGLAGARSSLAWEFIRALRSKKPRYFIWENVKGVLSSRGGWDFANLLTAFSESGYALWWQVLNAKDFGVPQNRERIFVIGFRDGSPQEVFFEPKDSGQIEIVGTTIGEENTRHGERDSVYGGGGIMGGLKATDYKQPPQILVQNKGESQHYRLYDAEGLAPTLQSQSGMSSQKHPFIRTAGLIKESEKPKGNYLPRERVIDAEGGMRALSTHESQMPYIVAQRGRNPENPKSRKSGLKTEQMLESNLTGNSNTLTGVEKDNYVFDGKVRKLMPIECERLMGWADNWTQFGINEKGEKMEISDSQRYKMCGNGVVSNVVRVIVEKLIPTLSTPTPLTNQNRGLV